MRHILTETTTFLCTFLFLNQMKSKNHIPKVKSEVFLKHKVNCICFVFLMLPQELQRYRSDWSTGCSCREPKSSSQYTHDSSQPSGTPVAEDLMPLLASLGGHIHILWSHTYIASKISDTQKVKIKFSKICWCFYLSENTLKNTSTWQLW